MEQITIKEVAKLCGVGVSTVSRAINNHPDINPETKQKILDVIREYNYVPNNSARNLKRADSNTIAVVIKEISNSYWGVMLHVLEREVRDRKYCLVLQNVADDEDEVELALQLEKRITLELDDKLESPLYVLPGKYIPKPENAESSVCDQWFRKNSSGGYRNLS